MLNQISILVAEDQPFIALDLALAVEDARGTVVGPAASSEEALALLANATIDGAIIDVNLLDRDCSDLVEALVGLDVPFIVHTALELPETLSSRFSGLNVQLKPYPAPALIARLGLLIASHRRAGPSPAGIA